MARTFSGDASMGNPTLNDVQIPSTPPRVTSPSEKSAFVSPPRQSASMTPPPSTQAARFHSPTPRLQTLASDAMITSPPATIRANGSIQLPSLDVIAHAGPEELRRLVQELVQSIGEARTSAAHFKLQHSLLELETQESAQRAEVEHQMTRREVEVLQAAEQRHRTSASITSRAPQQPAQSQLEALTKACKDMEEERDEAERRLRRAKKLIEMEKDRSELLMEENTLLKKRIRENREHFTRMKSASPIYTSPREVFTTPQRRAVPRFSDTSPAHAPFAALLAADQVLSGESASVPSTPTKSQPAKFKQGHTRGAHSLSSLHTTPARARPLTSDGYADPRLAYSAPGSQLVNESAERERHDRDRTISLSADEESFSDGDLLQSQASSLATSMLRKNPGSQESLRLSLGAEQSSSLLQTKLFGNVKKPGLERAGRKRLGSNADANVSAKKSKLVEGVGLGIGAWSPKA